MGYLWAIDGLSTGYLWGICGAPWGRPGAGEEGSVDAPEGGQRDGQGQQPMQGGEGALPERLWGTAGLRAAPHIHTQRRAGTHMGTYGDVWGRTGTATHP